tara:strand:- start:2185 stop:2505 length:321 start_codon:yes stop_codon:yes gene_type:complete
MPLFTDEQVQKLLGPDAEAEEELDLRGVQATEALSLLEQVVQARPLERPNSLVVRIDPATATSGETLFLPVGRALLDAKRRGLLARCHPLSEDNGSGFFVEFGVGE